MGTFVLRAPCVISRTPAVPEVPHKHELVSEVATVRNLAVRLLLREGSGEMSAAVHYLDRQSSFLSGCWGLRSSYRETQPGAKPPWPRGMESYECTCRMELAPPSRRLPVSRPRPSSRKNASRPAFLCPDFIRGPGEMDELIDNSSAIAEARIVLRKTDETSQSRSGSASTKGSRRRNVSPPSEEVEQSAIHPQADTMPKVGLKLRRLRTEHGLSLEKLAHLASVSRAMLGQIEMVECNEHVCGNQGHSRRAL